ncbi:MAG: pyridoxamine 5'-phosphate oxidase family protein, partial [Pseudomonadota bacterium]
MTDRIDTIEALEARYGQVNPVSLGKETPIMNPAYRRLFEACPFATLATLGPGGMDCSPRGDAPGFIRILDDRTLAIADRRGNNRLDTLRNI